MMACKIAKIAACILTHLTHVVTLKLHLHIKPSKNSVSLMIGSSDAKVTLSVEDYFHSASMLHIHNSTTNEPSHFSKIQI